MNQKVARQPSPWPTKVPSGTPRMLASVRPVNIRPMALARLFGGTTLAATTAPTPNMAPWAKAAITRAAIRKE